MLLRKVSFHKISVFINYGVICHVENKNVEARMEDAL